MRWFILCLALSLCARPAFADEAGDVEAELKAQERLNELLKQRIETLEAELAGRKIPPPERTAERAPQEGADDPEMTRALERALQRRGSAVLPAGVREFTTSLAWSHSGRDVLMTTEQTSAAGLDLRFGMKDGWMAGASVPFVQKDIEGQGQYRGIGDTSVSVWKSLMTQGAGRPSLVAGLRYTIPTAEEFEEGPSSLGSGFHSLTGRLSSVKTIDPIALYGSLSYTHFFNKSDDGFDVERDSIIGFGIGANLAVTPDITLNSGLSFAFEDELKVGGRALPGTSKTIGQVSLGAGFVLSRNVFLLASSRIGITEDAPDVSLRLALPIRF